MNHTSNYHLPQWVKEDRIMMDDFNQAMLTIDESLTSTKSTADGAKSSADESARAVAEQREQIIQCREENCLVKLGGPYEKPESGNISVEFPDLDLSQYRGAVAFVNCISGSRSSVSFGGVGAAVGNQGAFVVFFFNAGPRAAAISLGAITSGSNFDTGTSVGGTWGKGTPRLSCGENVGTVTLYLIKD